MGKIKFSVNFWQYYVIKKHLSSTVTGIFIEFLIKIISNFSFNFWLLTENSEIYFISIFGYIKNSEFLILFPSTLSFQNSEFIISQFNLFRLFKLRYVIVYKLAALPSVKAKFVSVSDMRF